MKYITAIRQLEPNAGCYVAIERLRAAVKGFRAADVFELADNGQLVLARQDCPYAPAAESIEDQHGARYMAVAIAR